MEKIAEYQIVSDRQKDVMVERVNELIGEDWQPYGPLLKVPVNKTTDHLMQPMVKYGKGGK